MQGSNKILTWILASVLCIASAAAFVLCYEDPAACRPPKDAVDPARGAPRKAVAARGPAARAEPAAGIGSARAEEENDRGELLVHCLTPEGKPAPFVRVRVALAADADAWREESEETADDRGGARFRLRPDAYSIATDRGGTAEAIVEGGKTAEAWIRTLAPHLVTGRVTNTAGRPIGNASLWLSRRDSLVRGRIAGNAGADGAFAVKVHGDALLGARHPSYSPTALVAVGPGTRGPIHLVMHENHGHVDGLVADEHGIPVAGASVLIGPPDPFQIRAGSSDRRFPPPPVTLVTDARGEFRSPSLEPGAIEITVRKRGFQPSSRRVDLRLDETVFVRVAMAPGCAVRGMVRRSDGSPVPMARVSCGLAGSPSARSATTGSDGRFRLEDLPRGEVELAARDRQGREQRGLLFLDPRREAEWDPVLFDPEDVPLLRGVLLDHRRAPLARWRILALPEGSDGRGVVSNSRADGSFALPRLRLGDKVRLLARRPGSQGVPDAVLDRVLATEERVEFVVPDPAEWCGRVAFEVVGPDGRRRPARIDVWHEELECFGSYSPDDGEFAADIPAGRVSIEISSEGFPVEHLRDRLVTRGGALELGTIRLREPAAVFGRILLPARDCPRGAAVLLLRNDGAILHADCAAGTYRSAPLAPGTYEVLAQAEHCAPSRRVVDLSPGEQRELDFSLAKGLVARIRLEVPAGADAGRVLSFRALDAGGRLLWQGGLRLDRGEREGALWLAEGSYRVVAEGQRGWHGEGVLDVAAGLALAPLSIALHR
ncbi:MAG: hypothetical protein Fur0037_06090 [Planctomycetota bacterium]